MRAPALCKPTINSFAVISSVGDADAILLSEKIEETINLIKLNYDCLNNLVNSMNSSVKFPPAADSCPPPEAMR